MKRITTTRIAAESIVVSLLLIALSGIQATLGPPSMAMASVGTSQTATVTPAVDSRLRLNEPVLRWLPEIVAASTLTHVPPALIAGVIRVESEGNPSTVSVSGARGLMQIMPDELVEHGVPVDVWFDPATNIRTGSRIIAERAAAYGSWESGVAHYFGIGCDAYGTCTASYVRAVFGWANYYAAILGNPFHASFGVLPADWSPPAIVPFIESAPAQPPEAPAPPTPQSNLAPMPTATPTETPTPTPSPAATATPLATVGATMVPTEVPTAEPTQESTEEPTIVPTEESTAVPTAAPPQLPTEDPAVPTTDASGENQTPEPTTSGAGD